MLIKENKLKQIIKSVLINNFILKENLTGLRPDIKENWIKLLSSNAEIKFEDGRDAGHKYVHMYGINDLIHQNDGGISFFNDLFNKDIDMSSNDKSVKMMEKNIRNLYNCIFENYIKITNLQNKKEYIDLFNRIVPEHVTYYDIAFINNFIEISEACKKTGIWDNKIIQKEMSIIGELSIDDLKNFTKDKGLQSKLRKNYPAEIIFSNLRSRNVHLIKLLSKEMSDETVNHIIKRLKNTIAYRRKKQNK